MKDLILRILSLVPIVFYLLPFKPFKRWQNSYVIPKAQKPISENITELPLPEIFLGYKGAEDFLQCGQEDVQSMLQILAESGFTLEPGKRALDLGCATGRMLRWLLKYADTCELWGTDVDANFVTWCTQNMSPPFSFFTCPTMPHLPFEDRYFDLIYAGSVFTHIDDLAETWLLELRRVLREGGRIYITIHDRNTVNIVQQDHEHKLALTQYIDRFHKQAYQKFTQTAFDKFTLGRGARSQAFYDIDYLQRVTKAYFDIVTIQENAYGYQTAVVLQRR